MRLCRPTATAYEFLTNGKRCSQRLEWYCIFLLRYKPLFSVFFVSLKQKFLLRQAFSRLSRRTSSSAEAYRKRSTLVRCSCGERGENFSWQCHPYDSPFFIRLQHVQPNFRFSIFNFRFVTGADVDISAPVLSVSERRGTPLSGNVRTFAFQNRRKWNVQLLSQSYYSQRWQRRRSNSPCRSATT